MKQVDVEPMPPTATRWQRLRHATVRVHKPLLVLAGVGTVLGGLAGYLNAWRAVRPDVAPPVAAALVSPPLSLLVLPLANQTGDPVKGYVADGLTTAISGDLGRLGGLLVVSPLTAVGLQHRQLTLPQLGAQAGVRFVLQGAVLASGDQLRVLAQLHETGTGAQLWSTTFEGQVTDLFALQDDITGRIRAAIEPTMIVTAARESDRRTAEPALADLLLRAQALGLQQQSPGQLREMETLYRRALALAPDDARALSGLAGALGLQASNYSTEFGLADGRLRTEQLRQAALLARRALASDPALIRPHYALANYAMDSGDHQGAVEALLRALELDPRRASTLNNLGVVYRQLGEFDRALVYFLRAHRLPALTPSSATLHNLARTTMAMGRLDEAVAWSRQGLEADPESAPQHATLAVALAMKGDVEGARGAGAAALRLEPRLTYTVGDFPWPGREDEYRSYVETRLRPAVGLAGLTERNRGRVAAASAAGR